MKALLWIPFLIVPALVQSNFILTILTFSFILAIAAVSFNLIFGFTGQLSMFHAAAFGIAAYITSLTASIFHVSFWVGVLFRRRDAGVFRAGAAGHPQLE